MVDVTENHFKLLHIAAQKSETPCITTPQHRCTCTLLPYSEQNSFESIPKRVIVEKLKRMSYVLEHTGAFYLFYKEINTFIPLEIKGKKGNF